MAAFLFPVRTLGQAPFSCWPRPELHFRRSLQEPSFFPERKSGLLLGINICDFQEVVPSKY